MSPWNHDGKITWYSIKYSTRKCTPLIPDMQGYPHKGVIVHAAQLNITMVTYIRFVEE
jgi:hypothetical protein